MSARRLPFSTCATVGKRRRAESGSVTMLTLATFGIGVLLILALGRVSAAAVLQARADAAADAAALAAADALALGRGAIGAIESARVVAVANDAELVECECAGYSAEVVVAVDPPDGPLATLGPARSRARAEVEPGAVIDPMP